MHPCEVVKCPALPSDDGVFSSGKIHKGSVVVVEKGDDIYSLSIVLYRPENGGCGKSDFQGILIKGCPRLWINCFL